MQYNYYSECVQIISASWLGVDFLKRRPPSMINLRCPYAAAAAADAATALSRKLTSLSHVAPPSHLLHRMEEPAG
jgi:hypothetical protein